MTGSSISGYVCGTSGSSMIDVGFTSGLFDMSTVFATSATYIASVLFDSSGLTSSSGRIDSVYTSGFYSCSTTGETSGFFGYSMTYCGVFSAGVAVFSLTSAGFTSSVLGLANDYPPFSLSASFFFPNSINLLMARLNRFTISSGSSLMLVSISTL